MKPEDLNRFFDALAALGQAAINTGQTVAGSLYTAARAAYVESGSVLVYGDTDEDFLRWLGEVSEAAKRDREKQKKPLIHGQRLSVIDN